MKKLLTFGMLLFMAQAMFGQLSLRPQVGINFASFTGDDFDGWSSELGYQFGADLQIGGTFYVQPGINYQSTKLTFDDVDDGTFETQRLNIPILVGIKLFEKEDAAFGARVFAGPNFALHLGEDFDEAIMLSSDDIKDLHVAGLVGAGIDFGIIFLDLGYKFGITKYIEVDNADSNKNVFIANAGVRIGF